jgi:hypothetical protein
MKLWYVSLDGKRQLYTDPRTGASELTRQRGEEIGEKLLEERGVRQVGEVIELPTEVRGRAAKAREG